MPSSAKNFQTCRHFWSLFACPTGQQVSTGLTGPTKKKGKARRHPPIYTSDEDDDELGGDSADVVSHDVGL